MQFSRGKGSSWLVAGGTLDGVLLSGELPHRMMVPTASAVFSGEESSWLVVGGTLDGSLLTGEAPPGDGSHFKCSANVFLLFDKNLLAGLVCR